MGKKPNFWNDFIRPVGKYIVRPAEKMLAPVAKPIIKAGTDAVVAGIKDATAVAPVAVMMKKGGMIKPKKGKKTMLVKAHQGELIVPKHLVAKVPKTVKDKIKKGGGRDM